MSGDGTPGLLRAGIGSAAIGVAGLGVGWALFPDSNLLGGLALVFAPLLCVGTVLVVIAGVVRVLLGRRA